MEKKRNVTQAWTKTWRRWDGLCSYKHASIWAKLLERKNKTALLRSHSSLGNSQIHKTFECLPEENILLLHDGVCLCKQFFTSITHDIRASSREKNISCSSYFRCLFKAFATTLINFTIFTSTKGGIKLMYYLKTIVCYYIEKEKSACNIIFKVGVVVLHITLKSTVWQWKYENFCNGLEVWNRNSELVI